jgi:septum formation topological specificity factor MinE
MKNNLALICENRLKNVLVLDKQINQSVLNVLKSDVLYVLKSYMEISADDLDLSINVDEFGFYDVKVNAKVRRLKSLSSLNE